MNSQPAALEIIGLSKTFDRPAVDRLDLTIRVGEFYALLGPNGAGKTTTLRMVAGLLRPDAGSISVLGVSDFVVVSVLGGSLASVVVLGITLGLAVASARFGWDLDNVLGRQHQPRGNTSCSGASHARRETAPVSARCAVSRLPHF